MATISKNGLFASYLFYLAFWGVCLYKLGTMEYDNHYAGGLYLESWHDSMRTVFLIFSVGYLLSYFITAKRSCLVFILLLTVPHLIISILIKVGVLH